MRVLAKIKSLFRLPKPPAKAKPPRPEAGAAEKESPETTEKKTGG